MPPDNRPPSARWPFCWSRILKCECSRFHPSVTRKPTPISTSAKRAQWNIKNRSEERRVGKECRYRGGTGREKEKKNIIGEDREESVKNVRRCRIRYVEG